MWNLHPTERLRFWFNFRQQINSLPLIEAIKETGHLWSYAPFVNRYLCSSDIKNWPGPWELIYENTYCDLAKSLGMLYTLYLSTHRPLMEIRIYSDLLAHENYNLVWIEQGKYVLNYVHDNIVNKTQIEKTIQLIKIIKIEDLNVSKIE
jgi:hypothetical protein